MNTDKKKIKTKGDISLLDALMEIDLDSITIFESFFDILHNHIKFDAGTIYLYNLKSKKLKKLMSYKQDVEIFSELQIEYGDGLSGWSAGIAQAIIIADRTKKKSYDPEIDFASFMSVPILRTNILYGVINLGSFTKNKFTQKNIDTLESIASTVSLFIKHYQLMDQFQRVLAMHKNSIEQLNILNSQVVSDSTIEAISDETSDVIHGINNSLSIIIGNLQCLLIGENEFNQKALSRLKKIESAAKKISESNNKILSLNFLVNKQADKPLIKSCQ